MGDGGRAGNGAAAPPPTQPMDDLEALLAAANEAESSADEGDLVTEEELRGPHTDELARRLADQEAREARRIQALRRQKKRLKVALASYKQKEKDFIAQMDAHMDEVERTEQDLSRRIEALTGENQQLREVTERRAQENSELVEKLNETTKQCGESETRVQFLVDRIVALLSAGAADPSQTEAVMTLRQREREMLRQLEETRQQFDEVRQQNGELTSRLTEELGLSRRLSDQLAEVEERFFHHRAEEPIGGAPRSPGSAEASLREAPRLGSRPLGLRSDPFEAPERPERAHPPDLPPPISEAEEEEAEDDDEYVEDSRQEDEEEGDEQEEAEELVDEEPSRPEAAEFSFGEYQDSLPSRAPDSQGASSAAAGAGEARAAPVADARHRGRQEEGEEPEAGGEQRPGEGQELDGERRAEVAQPAAGPSSPRATGCASSAAPHLAAQAPSLTGRARSELMEAKLRAALDKASFECPVVRIEPGVYNFGPTVQAAVQLTASEELVASRDGGPFEPIDVFVRRAAEDARRARRIAAEPALKLASAAGAHERAMSPRAVSPPPLTPTRYVAQVSPHPGHWHPMLAGAPRQATHNLYLAQPAAHPGQWQQLVPGSAASSAVPGATAAPWVTVGPVRAASPASEPMATRGPHALLPAGAGAIRSGLAQQLPARPYQPLHYAG